MPGTVHDLDCWPAYFWAVAMGEKTFEVRRNDRDFKQGDRVRLHELTTDRPQAEDNPRTGCMHEFVIGTLIQGGKFGIAPGYCVFSLLAVPRAGDD